MSLKKSLAVVLMAATVLSVGAGIPSAAKKSSKSDNVASCLGANVVVCDGIETGRESGVVAIAESQVPLADAGKVEADKKAEAEKDKKTEEKIAKQKKAAKKNYEKALRMLAAIVYCEAGGQCYAGRMAVAAVVMNRVESKGYPNTLKGVLWQPYQFGPIRQGKMARELKNYDKGLYNQPERKGSLIAARDILAGKYTVKYNGKTIDLKKYHNFNGHLSNAKIRISGHDFA